VWFLIGQILLDPARLALPRRRAAARQRRSTRTIIAAAIALAVFCSSGGIISAL